ncbi:MAG: hypothetical protein WCO12_01910 [bacterium]
MKNCSLLVFQVTSHEANSPKLLQSLAFCRKTLLNRIFKIEESGLLSPHLDPYPHFIGGEIDLGYNYLENANKIATMSNLWKGRESAVYENRSVAPIVFIDKVPHKLFIVKRYPLIPWFCPAFKIVLL